MKFGSLYHEAYSIVVWKPVYSRILSFQIQPKAQPNQRRFFFVFRVFEATSSRYGNRIRRPMTLDGARVLVTGGSGFLGANLIRALGTTGCRIRATLHDRPAVGGLPPAEYVHADFTRMDDCRAAVTGMDVVFMCAANTSGAAAITSSPLSHVTPNVVMNAQIMEAAHAAGVASSSSSAAPRSSTDRRPSRREDDVQRRSRRGL